MTRTSAEIGAGLLPARPPRAITEGERIHVVGAGGAGASAAALLAQRAGALVSGCDAGGASPYTGALEAAGIPLDWQHTPEHVVPAGGEAPLARMAVTKALTAVAPDHPELVAARAAGVPLESWQQLVADAAATSGQRLVAVAGTHGKSTTTGWLVDALVRGGRDPSAFVGALLPASITGASPSTARWGEGSEFVVEADEYAGNFDPYLPDVALLLNAEWDHPDLFADEEAVLGAFEAWLRRPLALGRRPTLVVNIGDRGASAVAQRLTGWPGELVTVGLRVPADVHAVLSADGHMQVGGRFGSADLRIGLPGEHNAANALMVYAAARAVGLGEDALAESLVEFGGVGRRLELKGEPRGVTVYDDYGHHPTAIAKTLQAVRERHPGRRLWAVYEPLTFHRTAAMLDQFARVLAGGADRIAIADIWAGRDPDTTIASAAMLADAVSRVGNTRAAAPGSVETTADWLAGQVAPGDVVVVMGGGRSYVIAARLVEALSSGASAPG